MDDRTHDDRMNGRAAAIRAMRRRGKTDDETTRCFESRRSVQERPRDACCASWRRTSTRSMRTGESWRWRCRITVYETAYVEGSCE